MKVIRVTETEFELEDGRIYEHPVELEEVPTVEEFQKIYDEWGDKLHEMLEEMKNLKDE